MPNMAIADRPTDALGAIDGALRGFIPMVPPMETNGKLWKDFDRKFESKFHLLPYELSELSALSVLCKDVDPLQALIETIPMESDLYRSTLRMEAVPCPLVSLESSRIDIDLDRETLVVC